MAYCTDLEPLWWALELDRLSGYLIWSQFCFSGCM